MSQMPGVTVCDGFSRSTVRARARDTSQTGEVSRSVTPAPQPGFGCPGATRATATLASPVGPVRLTTYAGRDAVAVADLPPAAALTLAGQLLEAASIALAEATRPTTDPAAPPAPIEGDTDAWD